MTIQSIRKTIVSMMYNSHSSHIGSCLSVVEILYTLYFKVLNIDTHNPNKQDRDKFILSKGHSSAALYATLAERGFFPKDILNYYYVNDGQLPGHLDMTKVSGIEVSAGSLGHGLSIGVGMSIHNMRTNNPGKIYVLLGDGECNEGSVWEAVMFASHMNLFNLTAIVDFNKLQGLDRTHSIISQENLAKRWQSFGWEVYEVDGHDCTEIEYTLKLSSEKPKVIIAHTIKGKGVSFMEDKLEWHYKSPNEQQAKEAYKELDDRE